MDQAGNILLNLPNSWSALRGLREREQKEYHIKIHQILQNKEAFIEWLIELRADFQKNLKLMEQSDPNRFEKALDLAMIDRAKKYGFVLDENGKIFRHMESSSEAFLKRFQKGEIFYDISFAFYSKWYPGFGVLKHGKESHALQVLLLAEFFPGFVEKAYKYLGLTKNKEFWDDNLDDPNAGSIANNAVFLFYVQRFLLRGRL